MDSDTTQPLHITNQVAVLPNGCRVWWEPDTDALNPCYEQDFIWQIVGWEHNRNVGHQPRLARDGFVWSVGVEDTRSLYIPANAFRAYEGFTEYLLERVWDEKHDRVSEKLATDLHKRMVMLPLCSDSNNDLYCMNTLDGHPFQKKYRGQIGWMIAARHALFDNAPLTNQRNKRVVMDKVMRDWMFSMADIELELYNDWANGKARSYAINFPWSEPGDAVEWAHGVYPGTDERVTTQSIVQENFGHYRIALDELAINYGMELVDGVWRKVEGTNRPVQRDLWGMV